LMDRLFFFCSACRCSFDPIIYQSATCQDISLVISVCAVSDDRHSFIIVQQHTNRIGIKRKERGGGGGYYLKWSCVALLHFLLFFSLSLNRSETNRNPSHHKKQPDGHHHHTTAHWNYTV
jgi:hypothetical protein